MQRQLSDTGYYLRCKELTFWMIAIDVQYWNVDHLSDI
jgi:hypothetical protein